MSAKQAALAEILCRVERPLWAVREGALGRNPIDAAQAPMAAMSPKY